MLFQSCNIIEVSYQRSVSLRMWFVQRSVSLRMCLSSDQFRCECGSSSEDQFRCECVFVANVVCPAISFVSEIQISSRPSQVFFRPTTAPAGKATIATPLPYDEAGTAFKPNVDLLDPEKLADVTPYPKPLNYQLYDEALKNAGAGNRGVVHKFNPFAVFSVTRFPANAPKSVIDEKTKAAKSQSWGIVEDTLLS